MAVQVWIGEKPEHPNERRAIMALANGLDRLEGLYLVLANFSVGGRTVDLVIVKHDAIFIIELKHCDGRVLGSVNGPWFVEGRNGERKRLNPGRKNPYNQVISYFHALTNFLNEHRREFLSEQKANDIDFRTCKRVVVIAPTIQEGSEIELDWKVELKGMDELPAYLITERSSEIELTDEEMLAIPDLLHCTPWTEVNAVLRGVMPDPTLLGDPLVDPPDTLAPAVPADEGSPALTAAPVEPAPADPPPAPGLAARARRVLRTTTGRVAAALAGVVAVLLAVLLLRPTQVIVPLADGPLAPMAAEATSDALSFNVVSPPACTWSGVQLVGKRYDQASASWVSVAAGAPANPEVVVALEQVTTCSGQIALTWSVQNNSDAAVEFPLRSDNIRISDTLGNEYVIADDASEPRAVRVEPGGQERGTAVVRRAVSQSATSLVVRLRDKPFGEASFVVSLQP
ncbi:NERD domain-containing protein [Scytonema tolypothrichoides VB-61278]|nr:NERD domain-containing protein [Scytonema tolypothrichoides VB-61278]